MRTLARTTCFFIVVAISSIAVSTSSQATVTPSTGTASQAVTGSQFRVLRSVSGSTGHEVEGRLVMDDPRSVFTAGKDAKVIVYFEWEGPLGPHHFEGLWKSPEGKIVLISDFRYEATKKQYSGYWTMLLSETAPSGEWTLEARIDGEFGGRHSFVITSSPTTAPAATPARQTLTTAELYQKAQAASVFIEKLALDGTVLDRSSGFWIGGDTILTAFEALDGSVSLRIVSRDGGRPTTDQVVAWNRWQDWAMLRVPRASGPFLKRAAANSVNVGDHPVFLETGVAGSRLTDGTITGKSTFPRAGERFLLVSAATATSIGGPLLDEYGDYVGIVGGTILPGASSMKIRDLMGETASGKGGSMIIETGAMAVPISQILDTQPSAITTTSLAELYRRGEFLAPIAKSNLIGFAQLAVLSGKGSNRLKLPREYRWIFSRRDGNATVLVNWQPTSKVKSKAVLRVFNGDNQKVAESKADNLNLSPGNFIESSWDIPLANLTPAIYRVDVFLGDQPVWRDFFRVTE